jgi:hypothetical protein
MKEGREMVVNATDALALRRPLYPTTNANCRTLAAPKVAGFE